MSTVSYLCEFEGIFAEVLNVGDSRASNATKHEDASDQGVIGRSETLSRLEDVTLGDAAFKLVDIR